MACIYLYDPNILVSAFVHAETILYFSDDFE